MFLMKVFLYENYNELSLWFKRPEFTIPFLHTNLLGFLSGGFVRNAIALGEDVQIFLPSFWEEDIVSPNNYRYYTGEVPKELEAHQKMEYELVFLTSLYSLLLGDFSSADISYLKQSPEKLFSNNGVIGGYLRKGQVLPKPDTFDGFANIVELTSANFLNLNQRLVENLNIKSLGARARTYGKPTILSENVSEDSTLCYPCFIGKDVVIQNSYIGPGTVLTGNTRVLHSKVFGSFLESSNIVSSNLHDIISIDAYVENSSLHSPTLLPAGSMIYSERKV
jgi:hypothetical protein